jgi:hypothetical protein
MIFRILSWICAPYSLTRDRSVANELIASGQYGIHGHTVSLQPVIFQYVPNPHCYNYEYPVDSASPNDPKSRLSCRAQLRIAQ